MNRPLNYTVRECKVSIGKFKGQYVKRAYPIFRQRVSLRTFCAEIADATTFTPGEVMGVLMRATTIAKRHVENGDNVVFGDLGTLSPSFKSQMIPAGEVFDAKKHISRPIVRLIPSRKYFVLENVSYERVNGRPSKKKPAESTGTTSEDGV